MIVVACALALFGTPAVFAAAKKGDEGVAKPAKVSAVEKMRADLNLTDEQVAKIKPLLDQRGKALGAARKLEDDGEKKAAMAKANKEFNTKLNAVLTPEQQEAYKASKKAASKKKKRSGE